MTTVLGVAVLRSLIIAVLLAGLAPSVGRVLARSRWLWVPLFLPLLVPALVVGYFYGEACTTGRFGASFYALLIALRLLPIAVLVQVLLPAPPISEASLHCARLSLRLPPAIFAHGPIRNAGIVFGLIFVLAFQEFELASLCGAATWTVWLFDAQAGGLPLLDTWRAAIVPVLIELLMLGSVLALFLRTQSAVAEAPVRRGSPIAAVWPLLAALVVAVIPLMVLSPGVLNLATQLHLTTELGHSILLAGAATVCCSVLLRACATWLLLVLCLPGLLGGLLLGLSIQAIFQLSGLWALYDTPAPLIVGWTLWLLPIGAALRLAGRRSVKPSALYLTRLLGSSSGARQRASAVRVAFGMLGAKHAMALVALFLLAFFEVVVGDLLAPSNMTPVAPRLYNLMHYGQSTGLAAMVMLMGLAGLVVAGLVMSLLRLLGRRWSHAL